MNAVDRKPYADQAVLAIWREFPGMRDSYMDDREIIRQLGRMRSDAELLVNDSIRLWQQASGAERHTERRVLKDDIQGMRDARDRYHRAWIAYTTARRRAAWATIEAFHEGTVPAGDLVNNAVCVIEEEMMEDV